MEKETKRGGRKMNIYDKKNRKIFTTIIIVIIVITMIVPILSYAL